MPTALPTPLSLLRQRLARLDSSPLRSRRVLRLGAPQLDGCFLHGGLPLGCWHEFTGQGQDSEDGVLSAAFTARLCAAIGPGRVVWALRRTDLHAPGLQRLGVDPARLILVRTTTEAETLGVVEDSARTPGVAVVVAEADRLDLTASRRLQLACEARGVTVFMLRRLPFGRAGQGPPVGQHQVRETGVAASRWRLEPSPSEPAPGEPGLGAERLIARLERVRGGRPGAFILEMGTEAEDDATPFRLVAELADHPLPARADGPTERRAAG